MTLWFVCEICAEIHEGDTRPPRCARCGALGEAMTVCSSRAVAEDYSAVVGDEEG